MVEAQLTVSLFDAIVFGVLFLSAMLSPFRGFIREALSLMAWVGAALVTLYSVESVYAFLLPTLKQKFATTIFATMGTYFVVLVSISIFNSIILRYIKDGGDVGIVDNFLGLLFGLFKGWVIIVLGFFLMTLVVGKEDYPEWVKTAYTRPYAEESAKTLVKMMPKYLNGITTLTQGEEEPVAPGLDEDGFPVPPPEKEESGEGYEVDQLQQLQDFLERGAEEPAEDEVPDR